MISLPTRKAWPALLALVALILIGAGCKDFFTDPKLTSIVVTSAQPSVAVAGTVQLQAVGTYDDNIQKDITGSVTWTPTPAAGTVTVSAGGLVTGVAVGSATITAKSGIVVSPPITIVVGTLTSITVTPANASVSAATGSEQFTATGHFSGGTTTTLDITSSVTWTASTTDVNFSSSTAGLATIVSVPTLNPITITATSNAATGSVPGATNLTITP